MLHDLKRVQSNRRVRLERRITFISRISFVQNPKLLTTYTCISNQLTDAITDALTDAYQGENFHSFFLNIFLYNLLDTPKIYFCQVNQFYLVCDP